MASISTLAIQSWTLYVLSISLIFSRLIFRRITLGHFKKFQADDWLMVLILLPYTASIVLANQVGDELSPEQRKYRFVFEEMQILTVWLVKACLLVLYWRIFPMETSTLKRTYIKYTAAFCCISFITVQMSLFLWCPPTPSNWTLTTPNPQCPSYHAHSILTLSLTIPTTLLTTLLPIPFIPTPRRFLLTILLLLGTLILITSIISRTILLTSPSPNLTDSNNVTPYLHWSTSESTLSIIFANLPFLTSLVATAAPARIRHLSHSLALAQWPRSRRSSLRWQCSSLSVGSRVGVDRCGSGATGMSEVSREVEGGEMGRWKDLGGQGDVEKQGGLGLRDSGMSSLGSECTVGSPEIKSPETMRPLTRGSEVPKMRLSGGLAEMGDFSVQETQGWPIYWK